MGCQTTRGTDGSIWFVCARRASYQKRCWRCGRPAIALCDGPARNNPSRSKTCDRGICAEHRIRGGEDIDFCEPHDPRHAAAAERKALTYQLGLLP